MSAASFAEAELGEEGSGAGAKAGRSHAVSGEAGVREWAWEEPQAGSGLALEAGGTATVTGPGEHGRMNAAGPATHGDEPPEETVPPRQTRHGLGRTPLQLPAQGGRRHPTAIKTTDTLPERTPWTTGPPPELPPRTPNLEMEPVASTPGNGAAPEARKVIGIKRNPPDRQIHLAHCN